MNSFSEVLHQTQNQIIINEMLEKMESQDQTLHHEKEESIFIHTMLSSHYSTCWNISSSNCF